MSMEFQFYSGPVTQDEGDIDQLFTPGDLLRRGVKSIEPVNLPDPSAGNRMAAFLGINVHALLMLNETTDNAFSNFVGSGNQRYIRIAPRLPQLVTLKEALPRVADLRLQEFLRVFIENCEHALDVGKNEALLVIF